MRHTFHTEQWVPYPITTVFAFFADPANLPRLMPSWQRARIEQAHIVPPPYSMAEPDQAVAGAGSVMSIVFRPFPLSPILMRWKASIVEFEWNRRFCDEQPEGPFAYWRHCHHVSEESRDGLRGTLVEDDLVYELPLGLISEPIHTLIVRRQIETIFRHRQQRLLELL
jgi:ligand-binding SRPBCC domain-containing protein